LVLYNVLPGTDDRYQSAEKTLFTPLSVTEVIEPSLPPIFSTRKDLLLMWSIKNLNSQLDPERETILRIL